jgi:hypothetical protein
MRGSSASQASQASQKSRSYARGQVGSRCLFASEDLKSPLLMQRRFPDAHRVAFARISPWSAACSNGDRTRHGGGLTDLAGLVV